MARAKQKHWYTRRTAKDAPSHLADQAYDKNAAWAEGYNNAVTTYLEELNEVARKEGLLNDEWGSPLHRGAGWD